MNGLTTVNLVLLTLLFLGLVIYLTVRIFFTREYLSYQTPMINASTQVISSQELKAMFGFFSQEWGLTDYHIEFQEQKFLNFGRNLKQKTHLLIFNRHLFESLGYELDYFLGRLWFSAQQVKKNRSVRIYSFIANYFIAGLTFLYLCCFCLQFLFFIVMIALNPDSVNNKFFLFLWKVPLIAIIGLIAETLLITAFYLLNSLKKAIELNYTHDTFPLINEYFLTYRDDFKIARQYAIENRIAYNLAFKTGRGEWDSIKWLGPFVKH